MVRIRAPASLAIVLLAGAVASCSKAQTIDLTMVDYRFIPDHLTFQHDVHYRLHMENHGKETHEVTAPIFFASVDIDNPDLLNHERSEIVMQPGDVKDLYFTPHRPGTYDLRCSDHDWDGMIGGITVD
jgi:plastocyanin